MGNSDSFDLISSSNRHNNKNSSGSSGKNKEGPHIIYSFDLNGIFRRIGDLDTTKSSSTSTSSSSSELADSNEAKQGSLINKENASEFNERLIDGIETDVSNEQIALDPLPNQNDNHKSENLEENKPLTEL